MTQAFNLALLANNVNSSGQLNADAGLYNTVNVANGGTNLSATPANGQLLIGNGTGYTLATLTASTGISVTNASGAITITNTNPNAVVDIQTFTPGGSTTWNKPTTGQTMVKIQVWGGGGGGGRRNVSNTAGCGGGGAYAEWIGPISYMASTAAVTIGAAGVGRTGSTGDGTAGGNSSVVVANYPTGSKTIIAYGGGPGDSDGFGGGGGGLLSGPNLVDGTGGKGYQASYGTSLVYQSYDPTAGGFGANGTTAYGSIMGGGGGGQYTFGGGYSYYGGGGGGYPGLAGQSFFAGNGGAGAAGTSPAGGGGAIGTANANGYDGGAGRVVITSW